MKAQVIILFVTVCLAVPAASSPLDAWQWRNPLPQGNRLLAVAGNSNRLVAVGEGATVLVSTNAVDWLVTNAPGAVKLNALCFANDQFIAVGGQGNILISTNGTA